MTTWVNKNVNSNSITFVIDNDKDKTNKDKTNKEKKNKDKTNEDKTNEDTKTKQDFYGTQSIKKQLTPFLIATFIISSLFWLVCFIVSSINGIICLINGGTCFDFSLIFTILNIINAAFL